MQFTLESLREQMPDYAKDTKLNLSKCLNAMDGLTTEQTHMVMLACAYTTKHKTLVDAVTLHVQNSLDAAHIAAAKSASSIMAMNNVYYRFIHLVADADFKTLPAGLRMNVLATHGIDKLNFELMSLAVSSINGCGMCMDSHVIELTKAGLTKQGIQAAVKVAAIINATAQVLSIEAI